MDNTISKKALFQLLGVAGQIVMTLRNRTELIKRVGIGTFNNILINSLSKGTTNEAERLYNYFLENEDYDTIERYFEIQYGHVSALTVTICDLYSDSTVWLQSFKSLISKRDHDNNKIRLISGKVSGEQGVEQYDISNIPENSVSLMLYDSQFNTGKTTDFLHSIISRQLIHSSRGTRNYYNGSVIMILTKKEIAENLTLILQHFEIAEDYCYTVKTKKGNRFILYMTVRSEAIDMSEGSAELAMKSVTKVINKGDGFNPSMYGLWATELPDIPFDEMVRSFKESAKSNQNNSDLKSENWNWIKDLTTVKDTSLHQSTKPTPLKTGEIANIIASGMVNGELCTGETGEHVVVGGTKRRTSEEMVDEVTRSGKIETKTNTAIYSEPYLNILISEDGKAKIKQLQGEESLL